MAHRRPAPVRRRTPRVRTSDTAKQPEKSLPRRAAEWAWGEWWKRIAIFAGTALVLWLLQITGAWRWIDRIKTAGSPPSIDRQLDDERTAAAKEGRRFIFERAVNLHGAKSYVVVVGDHRLDPRRATVEDDLVANTTIRHTADGSVVFQQNPVPPHADQATSDEVRVYDVSGKELRLRAHFQPVMTQFGTTQYVDGFAPFEVHGLRMQDVDGDGRKELVGYFGYFLTEAARPLPFIINWDDARRRYSIRALLPDRPALDGLRGNAAEHFRESYLRRVVLRDPTGATIAGYNAHYMTFMRGTGGIPRLLASFVRGPTQSRGFPLDVQGWRLNLGQDGPRFLARCFPPGPVHVTQPRTLAFTQPAEERQLRTAWRRIDAIACG